MSALRSLRRAAPHHPRPRVAMADTVLRHVNAQNRPFNAQNVADALGRHGIKKGLAQKYLDQLAERGEIRVKEAGKQKVYYANQDAEVMSSEETAAAEASAKTTSSALAEAKAALAQKHARLSKLAKQLTAKQCKTKTEQLNRENAELEAKLAPMRAAKGGGEITPGEMKMMEDAFLKLVDAWASRKRTFNDALEPILESTGASKKKMADDCGFEWDDETQTQALARYRKIADGITRKRAIEARQKKFKTNHAR